MSRIPKHRLPKLVIPKPVINASLEDWYNYFYKSKTKEMTLQFASVKKYMTYYYSFLQKDQIDGRCYDFLSIPNLMGKINKSKFSKMVKEEKASKKRKLDVEITNATRQNKPEQKKIKITPFEDDSDDFIETNIKIAKENEPNKRKSRPTILYDPKHFEDSESSVGATFEIAEENKPKKRKAIPTDFIEGNIKIAEENEPKKGESTMIFNDPNHFEDSESSVGATFEIAEENEPKKRKAIPTDFIEGNIKIAEENEPKKGKSTMIFNDPNHFEDSESSVGATFEIAEAIEPKNTKSCPLIFSQTVYSEISLSSGNDYDTGMVSPTDSFKDKFFGRAQKKRLEKHLDFHSDKCEIEDAPAYNLEGPLKKIKPFGRSESDSFVSHTLTENYKQVRFKERVEFQGAGIDSDSTEETPGFIQALTKKEEDEKLELEIEKIELHRIRLDDEESEYSLVEMGFIQYKNIRSPLAQQVDELSMKNQLLLKGTYRFDDTENIISQEISYAENTCQNLSEHLIMKYLKNANDEPIIEEPMKLILSISNEMKLAENLGEEIKKLQIVSQSPLHEEPTTDISMETKTLFAQTPSSSYFKGTVNSKNSLPTDDVDNESSFDASTDRDVDNLSSSYDASTDGEVINESDFESDKTSPFSSPPSLISSTALLPQFHFQN